MKDTGRSFGVPVNHRLERSRLEMLYEGRPDHGTIEALWRSQRSRRLLLLNSVIDAVVENPASLGPLPPVDAAVTALEAAEIVAPQAFRQILMLPSVGSWAAFALRRLHGFVSAAAPMWVDIGVIHVLALVAAYRANVDWRTVVPLRDGRIMLPGLGMASFPGAIGHDQADAVTIDGRLAIVHGGREVTVRASDCTGPEGWWPLRRVRTGSGPVLVVSLDDIDPFRELAEPVPPARLSVAEVDTWSDLLDKAWETLCEHHRVTAEAMSVGLVSIAPVPPDNDHGVTSGSTGEAFGALLVSRPPGHLGLAVALVHEFAHIQLGGLLHLIDMTHGPGAAEFYAPWRDDPRPLPGLLQGIYAFTAIAAFWRNQIAAGSGQATDLSYFEYALARGQVAQAIAGATRSPMLTSAGEELTSALLRRTRSWADDLLPSPAAQAARFALDAHRAGWRIRNLRPDNAFVHILAQAWTDGKKMTGLSPVVGMAQGGDCRWSHTRLALVRQWITADEVEPAGISFGSDADPADTALVAGDLGTANRIFTERIKANTDDLDAWTGLGLTVEGPARTALVEHPAVVRAVHRASGRPGSALDPVALATWTGEAFSSSDAGSNSS